MTTWPDRSPEPQSADSPTGDQIVLALQGLGIGYLSHAPCTEPTGLSPEALLMALASNPDARLRAALVPLLLARSDCAAAAPLVADRLSGKARVTLACSYSAAVAIQRGGNGKLPPWMVQDHALVDLFATDLDLGPLVDADTRLAEVAERHAKLSGEAINWRGTYLHAVANWLRFVNPRPA